MNYTEPKLIRKSDLIDPHQPYEIAVSKTSSLILQLF